MSARAREVLGAQLEQDRLAVRMARLERTAAALRARARWYRSRDRPVPPALRHSLGDFEREVDHVRRLLDGRATESPNAGKPERMT